MTKQELRSILRIRREAFVKTRLNQFVAHRELTAAMNHAHCVGAYLPLGDEVDLQPILACVAGDGVNLALPHIAGRDTPMVFRSWQPGAPLHKASFGFLQPLAVALAASPDLILVPLIGFDRLGNRLGQGAGHYDRYFASRPNALRVGIAWSCQEVANIPCDDWDVAMDAICTEIEWISLPHSRMALP